MTKEEKQALRTVLDYLHDEEKHYEESDEPENHIYKHILMLKNFLEKEGKLTDNNKFVCKCGEELEWGEQFPCPGQVGGRFEAYCTKCHSLWRLEDNTDEYEEMVTTELTDPQHGEYLDKTDNVWKYADGTDME